MSITFGQIRQIAFVVDDIDTAMNRWANDLGIGPFHVKREIVFDPFIYKGAKQPSPVVSIALSNSGSLQVELVQQHSDHQSIYLDFVERVRTGLQHIASWTDCNGYDLLKKRLLQEGYIVVQECVIPASGVRLCYFDTESADTPVFEIADLLEVTQVPRINEIRKDAESWDGVTNIIDVDA